eukprot:Pgem_evm1s3957
MTESHSAHFIEDVFSGSGAVDSSQLDPFMQFFIETSKREAAETRECLRDLYQSITERNMDEDYPTPITYKISSDKELDKLKKK